MAVFRLRLRDRPGSLETMSVAVNQYPPPPVDGFRSRLRFWIRNDASHLLWPSRCLVCEEDGVAGMDLCGACDAALPRLRGACVRCAVPLPVKGTCGRCLRRPPSVCEVHAACLYSAPIDGLLLRFKFHEDLAAGRLLSQLMSEAFASLPRPDVLVPVPLHVDRLRSRGYDQALELARPLARALDLPLRTRWLVRRRATAPQTERNASARRRNVRKAFVVRDDACVGRHVALIDDVMTTGATLHAAADALLRAGARRVDAWVCARTPP
jgi:ComF family protein